MRRRSTRKRRISWLQSSISVKDMARVFDGQNASAMLPLTVVQEYQLHRSAIEGGKLDAQLAFPGNIQELFSSWRVSFSTTIDGRDVYVVQVSRSPDFLATFYFHKQAGLLRRLVC